MSWCPWLLSQIRNCIGSGKSSNGSWSCSGCYKHLGTISEEENRIIFLGRWGTWVSECLNWMQMWFPVWISFSFPTPEQFHCLYNICPQFTQESLQLHFINFKCKPEINWDLSLLLLLLLFYLSLMIHRFVLTVVV